MVKEKDHNYIKAKKKSVLYNYDEICFDEEGWDYLNEIEDGEMDETLYGNSKGNRTDESI